MLDFTAHFGRRRRFGKLLCVCKYFLFIWFWGFAAVVLLLEKWGGVVFVAVVLLREKWLALMLSRGFCRGGTSSGEVVGFIATCGWRSCELRVAKEYRDSVSL